MKPEMDTSAEMVPRYVEGCVWFRHSDQLLCGEVS